MKKSTLSTLAALMITLSATTGLAAEPADNQLSVSGEATLHWERGKVVDGDDSHTGEQTFTLDFNQPLSEKFSLYTRFAYRHFSGDDRDVDSIHEIDQYGLIHKTDAGTFNLGSQALEFGTLASLVDLTEVGRDNMFKGATWTSENEHRNLHLIAGRVDRSLLEDYTNDNETLTGITLGKAFGDVTVSGEYLHSSGIGSIYGLGLSTSVNKWEFSLAGLTSSADNNNSGIIADATYTLSDTDTLSLTYRNFKDSAVISGLATYDPDTKGVELVWAKSLSDRWGLELSHEWAKEISTGEKTRTAYIETVYSF